MKKTTILSAALIAFFSIQTTAQDRLPDFSKIKVYGKLEVSVKIGQPYNVTVKTDEQYKKEITYKVVDNQLQISAGTAFPRQTNTVVVVSCPSVEAIELGGGAKCFNSGTIISKTLHLEAGAGTELDLLVECDSIYGRISKGGFAHLTGKTRTLTIKTTTGGSIASEELEAETLHAEMGGGIARTQAKKIIADLAPKAKILYTGSPDITKKEGSKGEIIPDEEQ